MREPRLAVLTTASLAVFRCPVCRGDIRTRSLARSLCRGCSEWVCNLCGAHGTVHVAAPAPAAPAAEASA